MLHASFLQRNPVISVNTDGNAPVERENSVISGPKQLAGNSSKTVLSEPCKGSIKQTNTSQVLVSETVPQRRVQLSRQAKKTRFGDNPVSSTVTIPARQPRHDTSTRNRRKFKLDVTDPDLLIPITKQTRVSKRHSSNLREPQTTTSDSQPASLQPESETITSESSVSLPSSPSGSSSTESTSTSLRHHPRAAHNHLQMLQAQTPLHQPVHHGQCHPNC